MTTDDLRPVRMAAAAFAALLGIGAVGSAGAATAVVPAVPSSTAIFIQGSTQGWSLSVTEPIMVTALGVFDLGSDGLAGGHRVSLWDDGGVRLADVNVAAGSHPLVDGFAMTGLATPVVLSPGGSYYVSDYIISGAETFATAESSSYLVAPEIIIGGDRRFALGDVFPASSSSVSPVPVGGGFEYSVVPEVSALLLLVLAAGCGVRRVRGA